MLNAPSAPRRPDAPALLALAERTLPSDPAQALRLAGEALASDPSSARAAHVQAEALGRLGQVSAAADQLRQLLRAHGELAELQDPAGPALSGFIGRFEAAACPLCGEQKTEPVWVGNLSARHHLGGHLDPVRTWGRCADCGLTRVERPAPPAALRAWRAALPPSAATPPGADQAHLGMDLHEGLLQRIRGVGHGAGWLRGPGTGPRLLEVGSGWGEFLAAASWRGFDAVGVEADAAQARWARQHLGVDARGADELEGLPEGRFDVIVWRPSIDAAPDPVGLLADLGAHLQPDGLLVLSVPLIDHPVHRLRGAEDPLWWAPERRSWFDRRSLARALLQAGLQPEGTWHQPAAPGAALIIARGPAVEADAAPAAR
jgi:SAM-dependent methyltransferase